MLPMNFTKEKQSLNYPGLDPKLSNGIGKVNVVGVSIINSLTDTKLSREETLIASMRYISSLDND